MLRPSVLAAALNIPLARHAASKSRYAISISLEATPTWASPLNNTYLQDGFQFGFMGGVGFEIY